MKITDHLKVPYSVLNDETKAGLKALQCALDDPQVKLATQFLELWSQILTSDQKYWLRYTDNGRKETWRRIGLAHELAKMPQHGYEK